MDGSDTRTPRSGQDPRGVPVSYANQDAIEGLERAIKLSLSFRGDAIAEIDFDTASQLGLAADSVIAGREEIAQDGVFTFPALKIFQEPETLSQIKVSVSQISTF